MNALSLGLWLRKGGHRLGILFYLIFSLFPIYWLIKR